jgi:hypothetical protein
MHERIAEAKRASLVVLKPTPALAAEGARAVVWEHGRRNMALQAAGIAPIICPVGDDELSGIYVFDTEPDEARAILSEDPGVVAGIFTFEVHACSAFPGDTLPG